MRRAIVLLALMAVSACGADGSPEPPEGAVPGIRIEGRVEIGVTGGG